ncbi:uncharacterized protein JCM15063_002417 [Sporobolomyces koalae]|uniref:uncharacterized protein n=1 Tax=Sporobolomyces koalae TaxID=500713 RepID=UPI00317FB3C3
MKDKQLYPRPAMPTKAESFMFRPSSPIRTPSTPSTRSFFSRLPKPSKPSPESTLIPWESTYPATPESASSMSRSLFATSPQSPPILDIVRPTSPASTYSRESTTSSSRWSNKWGRGKASSTTRQHDYNRGYNESWDSHPSQSWQSSDWPQEEEEQMHLRSPSKPEAKREKVKHVFGLKKKGSNFSLRSFVKAVGRDSRSRTSADYGSTPPESPVSSFTPSLHRQRSSPEISRHFARSASSSPLPSPILPLSFSTMVRERTVSSPLGIIEEQGSVKGKAARILGEAIVPQGKAARFLGVERKPTLKQKPSMSSLADSMRSGGTQKTVSESRQLGISSESATSPETAGIDEKHPAIPVHFLSLPIPQLNITPASPVIPQDNDYARFALSEREDNPPETRFGTDSPELDEKSEFEDDVPAYDEISLANAHQSSTDQESRRSSFPRFLHPEHLPPLSPPRSINEHEGRSRKRKLLLLLRLSIVLIVMGTAIGLGVGLSKPNKSATSQDVGGIAPIHHPTSTGPTAARSVNTVPPAWTKLSIPSSSGNVASSPSLAAVSVAGSNSVASGTASPTNIAVIPSKGLAGVQLLHQRDLESHTKHTVQQRRKLRQFGQGTVAGWR